MDVIDQLTLNPAHPAPKTVSEASTPNARVDQASPVEDRHLIAVAALAKIIQSASKRQHMEAQRAAQADARALQARNAHD